jgi:hypothetical protein
MGKVLSAQGSGYFPFCLTKGTPPSTGIDTEYPISLSLTKYMSWWWKVKTWNVTGSSTGNESWYDPTFGDGFNNWTTTGLVQDTYWTDGITSEESLVCQGNVRKLTFGFNGHSIRQDYEEDFTNESNIYFYPEGYINGTTIYPRIIINGWYNTYASPYSNVAAALDPASHLTIDGIVIPCHIYWTPNEYANSWSWTGSQNFVINPSTYWPYA